MIEWSIIFIWEPCNENLEIELLCSLCTSPDNPVNQNESSTEYIVEQNSESNIVMKDITIKNNIIT
jgi:methylglyoxal synthase